MLYELNSREWEREREWKKKKNWKFSFVVIAMIFWMETSSQRPDDWKLKSNKKFAQQHTKNNNEHGAAYRKSEIWKQTSFSVRFVFYDFQC